MNGKHAFLRKRERERKRWDHMKANTNNSWCQKCALLKGACTQTRRRYDYLDLGVNEMLTA
jgi:hypothetical protein